MEISRARFLAFARRIALVTGTVSPALAACAGSTSGSGPSAPVASATSSASSASDAVSESPPDYTAGSGPCRCSWDTNAAAASRVCKKGEINYAGDACIPAGGPSYGEGGGYPPPMKGPLPPPDLPA